MTAYDDPLGVTAAFNRNVLARMNRELGADFELRRIPPPGAVEPRGAPRRDAPGQRHRAAGPHPRRGPGRATFDAGESIWTESSYKYEPEAVAAMGARGGARSLARSGSTPDARFALTLFMR